MLLDDKMCSREDTASGDMTPSVNDLSLFLFPLTPLPHSTDLPSQPASTEQVITLLPPTSSAQSHLSSQDCLHPLPMANTNSPQSPKPNTTALPSSSYSDPELCAFNNENSSREKMTTEMDYLFNLFPLVIPLPQNTEQVMSQPPSVEQEMDMSTSTAHSTVYGSLPTLAILDSSTTSPQSSNCAPLSSTHSSEPERNRALNADKMCSREDTMASDDMTPSVNDLSLFLFPLTPLPHSTDLPSQPASTEQVITLLPPTSSAQSHLSSQDCLHPLPMANTNYFPQ